MVKDLAANIFQNAFDILVNIVITIFKGIVKKRQQEFWYSVQLSD